MNVETKAGHGEAKELLKFRKFKYLPLFWILVVIGLLFTMPFYPEHSFIHQAMEWSGYLLIILCVLGRSYSSVYAGGRKGSVLIQDGPFAVVRNPLYLFSLLGVIGVGLQTGSIILTALAAGLFAIQYTVVIRSEEQYLQDKFGHAYIQYKSRVSRWIPDFRQLHIDVEFIEMKPQLLFRTMRDASVFFLAFPVFELLEWLHESAIITPFIILP